MTTTPTDPNALWDAWVKLYSLQPATLTVPSAATNGTDATYEVHHCPTCGALFSHDIEDGYLFVYRRSWDADDGCCQCEVLDGTWNEGRQAS